MISRAAWFHSLTSPDTTRCRYLPNLARGLAAFIGSFTLINLAGSLRSPTFDASHWWISAHALPRFIWAECLFVSSALLLAFACKPPRPGSLRQRITILFTAFLLLVTLINGITFYDLLADGLIDAGVPFPLSFLFSGALALVLWNVLWCPANIHPRRNWLKITAAVILCTFVFPLTQMFFFGKTDYRRRADAAVVFGARAYADGRLSDALAVRVNTACELYRQAAVSKLIFSGGPGDGAIHETEAMQLRAISLGVNPRDIILDVHGVSTQATVQNTTRIFGQLGFRRVLAVSHYFHLPRIKMTYQRNGVEVYTTPAKEPYILRQTPFLLLRETAAWWLYYLRPLIDADVLG